jgi:Ca2+-binding RTX toxin-like protein
LATSTKHIAGTGADDRLQGTSDADSIKGNAGNDVLFGLMGDDTLDGGTGNDVLDGGRGSDTLAGGNGADLFVSSFGDLISSLPAEGQTEAQINLYLGHDVVTDFVPGMDHLQMLAGSNPVVVTIAQLQAMMTVTQADVDGDGRQDTVLNIDYFDAAGVHWTDSTSSITLLGVSGGTIETLYAG